MKIHLPHRKILNLESNENDDFLDPGGPGDGVEPPGDVGECELLDIRVWTHWIGPETLGARGVSNWQESIPDKYGAITE